MTQNKYFHTDITIFLIVCCCISCNETFYKHPQNHNFFGKRTNYQNDKNSRSLFWENSISSPSSVKNHEIVHSTRSNLQANRFSYTNDLVGEEARSSSNSIWGNKIDKFHSSHDKTNYGMGKETNRFGSKIFEKNVNGLVDDFLYSDYEDYYDYPTEELKYNGHSHHMTQFGHSSENQNTFNGPFLNAPYYNYRTPVIKADRRSDHVYQTPVIKADRRSDHVVPTNKPSMDFLKNSIKDNQNYHNRQEGKQIISGIDINPLTSNALISLSNGDPFGNPYDINHIVSDVRTKTGRIKNSLDHAVRNIGDATIGRINKKKLKSDMNYLVTGINNTINEIDGNSINNYLRQRLNEVTNLKTKDRWADDREYVKKKSDIKQKKPGIIKRFKDKAKNVGNYVLKQAKQILVEPSPILKTSSALPKLAKKGQNDRQAIDRQVGAATLFSSLFSSFGGGLFATGGPVAAGFSVTLLVLLEVVSMGIESALQINQGPTVATTAELTTTTTQGKIPLISKANIGVYQCNI